MLLFGIPTSGPDASDIVVEHVLGHANILIDGNPELTIEHHLLPAEQYDSARFAVYPCYTGFTSASQITELRIGSDRNTFGFVFPVTSFRNEIGFSKKYGLIYADAAFRKFITVENLTRFQSSFFIERSGENEVPLDAVVNDSLSILVVSRETLEEHNVSLDALQLMLQRCQVEISYDNKEGPAFVPSLEFNDGLNLVKPKTEDADVLSRMCMLLRAADDDNSKVGQFIQYYQFFEFMILKIFEWGIPHVANGGASPWDVKERLRDLGAERKRLQRLDVHCVPGLKDRGSQARLATSCKSFLDTVGVDTGEKTTWHSLLYLVRNSVVHNQFKLLTPDYLRALGEVNVCLRAVALD